MPYEVGDSVVVTDPNTIKYTFNGTPIAGTVEAENSGVYVVKFGDITLRLKGNHLAPANGYQTNSDARMGYQNFDVSLSQDIDTAVDMVNHDGDPNYSHQFLQRALQSKMEVLQGKMRALNVKRDTMSALAFTAENELLASKIRTLEQQANDGHQAIDRSALGRRNIGQQNYGYQQVATTTSVQQMQQEFRDKWTKAGASPNLIDKALKLAEDWTRSLAEFSAPNDIDLQNRVYANIYPRALNTVADHWINAFIGFVRGTQMMGQYFRDVR